MKQRQICMALDLKDDPRLIEEYKNFHLPENIWPEIPESIRSAGVRDMQIFLVENHLFMIMDVENDFDSKKKEELDARNPVVQRWEKLMWTYQQALPSAKPGQKWVQLERIFQLSNSSDS
jgi:L-rhamnose mutarotase|tara:strand:- start:51223 stop:51582 length:360 start_codon:yes stop_codon:yes gene_type:complete